MYFNENVNVNNEPEKYLFSESLFYKIMKRCAFIYYIITNS